MHLQPLPLEKGVPSIIRDSLRLSCGVGGGVMGLPLPSLAVGYGTIGEGQAQGSRTGLQDTRRNPGTLTWDSCGWALEPEAAGRAWK